MLRNYVCNWVWWVISYGSLFSGLVPAVLIIGFVLNASGQNGQSGAICPGSAQIEQGVSQLRSVVVVCGDIRW